MPGYPNRALLVDDDDDMRFLLRVLIERANEGLVVAAEAADGTEALDRWRQHRPDVVILDQRMPGTSGLEVAERMLSEEPGQSIILFTAYLDDELLRRAGEIGIRACISKDDYDAIPEALWRYGPAA